MRSVAELMLVETEREEKPVPEIGSGTGEIHSSLLHGLFVQTVGVVEL